VIAIESNPDSRFIEKAKSRGIPVIIADARRTEYLIKANIKTADAVIPCTDDELTNLDIALDARELNPDVKVVMRLFDPDLARRVEKGFGIHTAFSTSALAAPIFATASMRVNVKTSFYVQDTLLNVSALTIRPGSALSGYKVRQLEEALDLSVICYTQGGNSILHPDSDLSLQAGADILVLATLDVLTRLEDMNSVKG
jgi:voltage-gated potassium channel